MKSAEFAALIRKRGYTKEYVAQLIETHDREVTAKALRDAAENIGVLKSGGGRGAYGMAAAMLRDMAERAERGES